MSLNKIFTWIVIPIVLIIFFLVAITFFSSTNSSSLLRNIFSPAAPIDPFGSQDKSHWRTSNLDWQTSPVDLSFLNANEIPAGKHGFLKASGDSLIFEDGSSAKFWGTNLTAAALFGTSKDNVVQQAKRISALGFNLVRIHHFDSPWVNPNIFGKDAADTQNLDSDSMKQLDWWIKCLKNEGIYVWLDLHVQRAFTTNDNIYGFDEIRKKKMFADLKGYNYVNPTIQNAMERFNAAYLNHSNFYTGVAYKNEPAIIALLITNENDITHHYGNELLPDHNVPLHNQLYMNEANIFANMKGLQIDRTWRSWEDGPSKIFLNDLEHRFDQNMIFSLRQLGIKVPIATTSFWGKEPLFSLPALTTGDLIDVHGYGEALEISKNPLTTSSLTDWLSIGQIAGKPMSITEWNVSPFPVPDRHTSPLHIASTARLQGWDAVMIYGYAQVPLNDAGKPSNWHSYNDPSLLATLPAAALLYRKGHVKEAVTTYVLTPDREQLFYQSISPETSVAVRTASEKGKVMVVMPKMVELPWLKSGAVSPGATAIKNYNQSLIPENATEVSSDTGEIKRNWIKGIYTINTAQTQAAAGMVGDEKIRLADVNFYIKTRNASIAVQSLDGEPINVSSSLMISLGTQSQPSRNGLPFLIEPLNGQIVIHAHKGMKLYKSNSMQKGRRTAVAFDFHEGEYVIKLDPSLDTSWLFLD